LNRIGCRRMHELAEQMDQETLLDSNLSWLYGPTEPQLSWSEIVVDPLISTISPVSALELLFRRSILNWNNVLQSYSR
jgi:hypothetical protein